MSKKLACLVGRAEKEVVDFVAQMEDKLFYPSVDVRLLAEVTQAAKQKTAELGLDPHDTTGEELYHALQAKFERDAEQVDRAIGLSADADLQPKIERAIDYVQRSCDDARVWALKNTVARSLLRALPPKKTIQCWHYRSLESFLKREDLSRALLVAQYIESAAWLKAFSQAVGSLSAADYEQRLVNFATLENMPPPGPADFVAASKIAGAVAIWPDQKLQNVSGLHLALLLLQGLNELSPSVSPKTIANNHPLLNWWANFSHVVSLHEDKAVSFNIHDVVTNHLHGHDFAASLSRHGGQSLWAELQARYESLSTDVLPAVEAEIQAKTTKLKVPTPAQLAEDMVSV